MDLRRRRRVDRLAAVGRHLHVDAAEIDDLGIVRIDAHLAEVHRTRVVVVHLPPRRARIVGPIEAGRRVVQRLTPAAARSAAGRGAWSLFGAARWCAARRACAAAGRRRRPFDQRVQNARALAINVDADASERSLGDAALQPRPRLAGVGRFPDATARATAVHAACGAAPLIRRRVEDLVVGRIHHEVVGARVVVDLQDLLPRLAAVDRFVDPALAARPPEAAGRRDEDDVVCSRIDDDAADVAGGAEADVGVGLAAVGRLVDAVAPRCALTVVRFTGPDPDEIRVVLRHGDVADRHEALILHLRLERRPVVRGLPHAAVAGADVEDRRVRFVNGEVGDPARHAGRPDRAEVERVERPVAMRRGGRYWRLRCASDERLAGEDDDEQRGEGDETILPHERRPPENENRWCEIIERSRIG